MCHMLSIHDLCPTDPTWFHGRMINVDCVLRAANDEDRAWLANRRQLAALHKRNFELRKRGFFEYDVPLVVHDETY